MPESNDKTDTAAIAAARQYHRAVQAAERRASLSRQATAAKGRPRESLRAHCRRLNVPYTTVSRHCQALKSTGRLTLSERGIGRPRALTDADDATLVAYIVELEWAGVRVSKQMVVARANELRSLRSPGAGRLNRGWYARWRLDHDDALRAAAANIAQSSRVMEGWDPQARVRRWQTVQDGLDKMYLTDGPMPTPGEGEVLVEIRAVSINYRDTEVANGIYKSHHKSLASTTPSPIAPCSDMCGVVVGVGPSSSPWRLGDRVVSTFLPGFAAGQVREHHLATSLGFPADGVLQTHRVFSAAGLVRAPAHLSDDEAACLPVAALTAWMALFWDRPLGEAAVLGLKGKTVLVQGTGGVSICGLQIAKASGATVIITSSSDAKLERAKALGADHGINYKTTPEWQDEVLRLTGGRGADVIFECGGAETLHRSLQCVSFGGLVSCIGYLSGTHEKVDAATAGAAGRPHVNLLTLTRNSTTKGILNGPQDRFVEMNAFLAEKGVKPLVERVFPLEDAKEAMLYLASGSHFGKVVVRMS